MSTNINRQLYEACRDGNLTEVKRLVAAGADVNVVGDFYTALSKSSVRGQVEIVRFLLDSGADVDQTDGGYSLCSFSSKINHFLKLCSYTALYFAARNGRTSVVDLLAFTGVTVNQTCARFVEQASFFSQMVIIIFVCSWTPLIVAVCYNRADCIETFVVFGADIDAVDVRQATALCRAVRNQRIEAVRLLLSLNADTTKVDRRGRTALQIAETDEIKQIFLEHDKLTVTTKI